LQATKSIEQIKTLDLSDANFKVHFAYGSGDEDVIEVRAERNYTRHTMRWLSPGGSRGARASAFSDVLI